MHYSLYGCLRRKHNSEHADRSDADGVFGLIILESFGEGRNGGLRPAGEDCTRPIVFWKEVAIVTICISELGSLDCQIIRDDKFYVTASVDPLKINFLP